MQSIDVFVGDGLNVFDGGLSCSETVAIMGMKRLGRSSELVPRIATGFGGGVSRTQSLCGTISGAVLVLGAAYGRDKPADDRSVILAKVQDLMASFRARFGSDNCYALTGLDFNDPGALTVYRERVHGICRSYVEHVLRALYVSLPAAQPMANVEH